MSPADTTDGGISKIPDNQEIQNTLALSACFAVTEVVPTPGLSWPIDVSLGPESREFPLYALLPKPTDSVWSFEKLGKGIFLWSRFQ